MTHKILAINPGSTSTKFAVYEGENQILSKTLNHSVEELSKFNTIMEQFAMRKSKIENTLRKNNIKLYFRRPAEYQPVSFFIATKKSIEKPSFVIEFYIIKKGGFIYG